ncbi:MAG: hypothetical protein ACRDD3_02830, partial [Azovibrio sp.]
PTQTQVLFGFDYMKSKTSHADYFSSFHDYNDDIYIVYNGRLMRSIDRPADNYDRPWTARLLLSTSIPAAKLTINHFFRYRDGYEKMVLNGTSEVDGVEYDNYEKTKLKSAFTWDMRVNWELPSSLPAKPYISLSIDNVLNASNTIEDTGSYLVYEKGRQFWLETGINF